LKGKEMRLSFRQFEIFTLDTEHFFGAETKGWLFDSRANDPQRGFTLVELVMTIVILGIIAAVAVPRLFNNNVFQSRGFADQVQASLRYAQKEAIAQHRNVCLTFTLPAPSTITLRIASLSGVASSCDTNLIALTGGAYVITAPAGIAFATLPTAFNFDALGKPFDVLGTTPSTAQKSISINGATNNIFVEAETGYVHSP
jgi:MSHA pilin protein MshC